MKLNELKTIRTSAAEAAKHVVKIAQKSTKPVMVMMVALPGSGKSTFIQKLEDELTKSGEEMYTVASTDDMVEQAAKEMGLTYSQVYGKLDLEELKKKFLEIVKKSIDDKKPFVIDRTNLSKDKRHGHVGDAKSYTKIAVAFELDPKVHADRLLGREKATGKKIPDDVMKSMRDEYEPPTHDEGFDEVIFINS